MKPAAELPGILAEIEKVVGRDAAVRIAMELGGEAVYVPQSKHLSDGHRLVAVVGRAATLRLADRFAGDSLHVPMARRAVVRHLSDSGHSAREIARRLGISLSVARRYKKSFS